MKRFKKSICRILTLAMLISALTCGTVFADEQEGVFEFSDRKSGLRRAQCICAFEREVLH